MKMEIERSEIIKENTLPEIIKEDIEHYTEDQLRYYFNCYWKDSKSSFARTYHINSGSFSMWTNSKRDSPSSIIAVRKYLNEYCDHELIQLRTFESKINPPALIERIKSLTKYSKSL